MKKVWKWILGILLVLVVVGGLAAAAFMMRNHALARFSSRNFTEPRAWKGPNVPQGWNNNPQGFGYERGPMMRNYGWDGPMGKHRGFGFFGPSMFIGGLLRLAFFGALLYGAYWLGKRNARITLDPRPVAPAVTPVTQSPIEEPVEAPKRGRKVANDK